MSLQEGKEDRLNKNVLLINVQREEKKWNRKCRIFHWEAICFLSIFSFLLYK